MIILPHFFSWLIFEKMQRIIPITIDEFEKITPSWGAITFENIRITFDDVVQLDFKTVHIRYSLKKIFNTILSLDCTGEAGTIESVKKDQGFFGITTLTIQSFNTHLEMRRWQDVIIEWMKTDGNFGTMQLEGVITRDKTIDCSAHFLIHPEFISRLSLPTDRSIHNEKNDVTVDVTIDGMLMHPDISITSDFFQINLESKENT
ncbi:MAG: hypothetical protein KKH94_13460 [Candidatus Omnitrophica bacterium]|nr:hypothetical protein [Candidatus Omnitrophota bacterium]